MAIIMTMMYLMRMMIYDDDGDETEMQIRQSQLHHPFLIRGAFNFQPEETSSHSLNIDLFVTRQSIFDHQLSLS